MPFTYISKETMYLTVSLLAVIKPSALFLPYHKLHIRVCEKPAHTLLLQLSSKGERVRKEKGLTLQVSRGSKWQSHLCLPPLPLRTRALIGKLPELWRTGELLFLRCHFSH